METPDNLVMREIGNEEVPDGIRVELNVLGFKFSHMFTIDTDPEYIAKLVVNTIKACPKSLKFEFE